jgi:hypothetical protein
LEACSEPFLIYTDHQALQYFQASQRLLPRHVRWSQDLNAHRYSIKYRPARENCKADALSRRPDYDSALPPINDAVIQPVAIISASATRPTASATRSSLGQPQPPTGEPRPSTGSWMTTSWRLSRLPTPPTRLPRRHPALPTSQRRG